MNEIKDGGPAFPTTWVNDSDVNLMAPNGQVCPPYSSVPLPGLSLRDYFAAKAMQGYCAREGSIDSDMDDIASDAYAISDAMLRAREES